MSGLESALARIGAIERMVSGVPATATLAGLAVTAPAGPGVASGPGAATSFADALDQAARFDSAASSGVVLAPPSGAVARGPLAASRLTRVTPSTVDGGAARAADAAYRPAHVTETDERVWNDCTWASATMWIDKLTGGAVKVDREALRAASGDRTGGSSLGDVVRGARKLLGLDLRAAHAEKLTVAGLLERLEAGGGAIVQGSYASLRPHLTRHDPGFAAKGVGGSGHAVYVGPLDPATGKVWWDDPLAPAGGSGEWISVKDLKSFLWTDSRGRVSAMATPPGATSPATTFAATPAAATSSRGSGSASPDAVSAAARASGVDPLLLTAYLDVSGGTSTRDIAAAADDLAAAVMQYGKPGLALESLGAARVGSTRLAEGALFAGDVLTRWSELLGRRTGG